jgi:hypothetical protein
MDEDREKIEQTDGNLRKRTKSYWFRQIYVLVMLALIVIMFIKACSR